MKGRLVTTDPDLIKSFFPGHRGEISSHLLRRMESPCFLRLGDDVPGPTKQTPQTASHAVRSGNSSVIGRRPEPVVFPLLSRTNNLFSLFS